MKIVIRKNGSKQTIRFNINEIVRDFYQMEDDPERQIAFLSRILDQSVIVENALPRYIRFPSWVKRRFLYEYRYIQFILFGLLKLAEDERRFIQERRLYTIIKP